MKPLVYIAGPYTSPDPMLNVHDTLKVADDFIDSDLVTPIVPHLSAFWQAISPRSYEQWLAYDLDIIRHCDGLWRLPGESNGADREVEFANEICIPVFGLQHRRDMEQWARRWTEMRTHAVVES